MKTKTLLALLFPLMLAARDPQRMTFTALMSETETQDIVILNFWATWCQPCVKELPHFEKINEEYAGKGVRVILVNLDFNSKFESAVIPFVQKKELKSDVIHIDDTDPNTWIDRVDKSWSGAIPATAIYRNASKQFFKEGEMTYEELHAEIEKLLPENDKTETN